MCRSGLAVPHRVAEMIRVHDKEKYPEFLGYKHCDFTVERSH